MSLDPMKCVAMRKYAIVGPSSQIGATYRSMRKFLGSQLREEGHYRSRNVTETDFEESGGELGLSSSNKGLTHKGQRRLEISFVHNVSFPFGRVMIKRHIEEILDNARSSGINLDGLHRVPYFSEAAA